MSPILIDGRIANPPGEVVHRIYREARSAVSCTGVADLASQQSWLRRVSREFHRRLRAAGIHVEGGGP